MENIILKNSLTQISVAKASELSELCEYCIKNCIGYDFIGGYVFVQTTDIPKLIDAGYLQEPEQADPSAYEYGE